MDSCPSRTQTLVPVPPVLVAMFRAHFTAYGTAPDGRLFRGTRGGPLSESVYGRAWHSARALALGPELAASGLARRPYDLRHAALSLWLNAGGDPAEIAARAGNSVAVLLTVYCHRIHGHEDLLTSRSATSSGRPQDVVRARPWKASGCTDRATGADVVRYASVVSPPGPPTARGLRRHQTDTDPHTNPSDSRLS